MARVNRCLGKRSGGNLTRTIGTSWWWNNWREYYSMWLSALFRMVLRDWTNALFKQRNSDLVLWNKVLPFHCHLQRWRSNSCFLWGFFTKNTASGWRKQNFQHMHISRHRCGQMVLGTKVNGWGWPSWFFWWGRWMRPGWVVACGICFFFVETYERSVRWRLMMFRLPVIQLFGSIVLSHTCSCERVFSTKKL